MASVTPGDAIVGAGIPEGDTIATVDSATSVWLSRPAAAAVSNTAVTITSRPASYGVNAGELFDTGGAINVTAGVRAVFGDTSKPPLPVRFEGQTVATLLPGPTAWSDWVYMDAAPGMARESDTTAARRLRLRRPCRARGSRGR